MELSQSKHNSESFFLYLTVFSLALCQCFGCVGNWTFLSILKTVKQHCTNSYVGSITTLLQPYYKKSYNVTTTDNYFASLKLAEELKQKKTTILGTIRKQPQEVPSTELIMKDKELYASEIFSSPSGCSLTIYKAKKKKVVCILSSMHRNVNIDQCHKKKLLETIQYYNKSKVGVGCTGPDGSIPYQQEFHLKMACGCIFQYSRLCLHKCLHYLLPYNEIEIIKKTVNA